MLVQERISFYKCRILDFSLAHKFGPGESPRQAPSMRFMLPLWLATCSTSDIYSARANKAGLEALRFKFADFDPRP